MEKTNINLNCNSDNTPNCDFQNRGGGFNINQPCDGTARVYFENFSCLQGETSIQIFSNTTPPCIMTAIIEFQNGETIERTIPGGTPNFSQGSFTLLSSNAVRRLSIRCSGNPTGFCTGFGNVNTLVCLCCPNDNCCNTNCNTGFNNNNCCNTNCNTGFNNNNCCNTNCNTGFNNNNCCNTNCNTGFNNNNCCHTNCNTRFNNNCCNSNCDSCCCKNNCKHISDDHYKKDELISTLLKLHKPVCESPSKNRKRDLIDILTKINLSL